MWVKDLLGNEYKLNLSKGKKTGKKFSKLHQKAIAKIRSMHRGLRIHEDLAVTVKPGLILFLDIYIPKFEFTIEVHGRQHYEYINHFHKYEHRFGRAKLNDALKKEWCQVNNIGFLELPYNESDDEWARGIRAAIKRHTGRIFKE